MITYKGKYSEAVVYSDEVDEGSASQIMSMLNSPAITNPVRIMPDFHVGKGSVIGFTMKAGDYIIPNIVGVDIGCSMLTAKIERPNLSVEEMDSLIREAVPVGFNIHNEPVFSPLLVGEKELIEKVGMDYNRFTHSIGTLGGGNHFIEVGEDDNGDMYVTIHSGSRNFGLQVANYHQKKAKEFCEKEGISVQKDLEFCPTDDYVQDMLVAQKYARTNRTEMLVLIMRALNIDAQYVWESVHNFIDPSDKIIRKGATTAHVGNDIILPFNRTEGIWIMEGLGNPDWNFSAPHGAGRRMSRGEAKRNLTQEQVDNEMKQSGVYSTSNPVDEAPQAYKDPEDIKRYTQDTAKYLFNIKPILNIKG